MTEKVMRNDEKAIRKLLPKANDTFLVYACLCDGGLLLNVLFVPLFVRA